MTLLRSRRSFKKVIIFTSPSETVEQVCHYQEAASSHLRRKFQKPSAQRVPSENLSNLTIAYRYETVAESIDGEGVAPTQSCNATDLQPSLLDQVVSLWSLAQTSRSRPICSNIISSGKYRR